VGACSPERARSGRQYRCEARARRRTGESSSAEHGCVVRNDGIDAPSALLESSSRRNSAKKSPCCVLGLPASKSESFSRANFPATGQLDVEATAVNIE